MRGNKIGDDDLDLIFGTSEGAAYERAVEARGDDVGYGNAAFLANLRAPSGSPPASRLVSNYFSSPPPGAPPSIPSSYSAPSYSPTPSSSPSPFANQQFSNITYRSPWSSVTTQTQQQQQQQEGRRRHHHRRHRDDQAQQPGAPGYPGYPVAVAPVATVNTSWPPPRPDNFIPGAPWPPPGAAPGSDLSSFYPAGTPQASSTYWGTPTTPTAPPPAPAPAAPVDVYIDNPSYSTLGMRFDSLGRAEIVDMPGRSAEAQMRRSAEAGRKKLASFMGAADHKFDVIALRAKLRRIGMDVPKNGSVDQPLADAVNGIFRGWDDAPKGLRAGDMTPQGLKTHIKLVNQLVDKAIGGAQHLENADRGA